MDVKPTTTSSARQAKYRAGQEALGRRARLMYLTDEEKAAVGRLLAELRAAPKS